VFTLVFDDTETWDEDKFVATAAHEIGHLLGLRHAAGKGQLMSPFRSSIKKPTKEDVKRLAEVRGRPWKIRTEFHEIDEDVEDEFDRLTRGG
jgi:hypothetical protein